MIWMCGKTDHMRSLARNVYIWKVRGGLPQFVNQMLRLVIRVRVFVGCDRLHTYKHGVSDRTRFEHALSLIGLIILKVILIDILHQTRYI
jgi:hypothetical protein